MLTITERKEMLEEAIRLISAADEILSEVSEDDLEQHGIDWAFEGPNTYSLTEDIFEVMNKVK
jgi:type II secretory pathway component GspD/PulD (secretin)